MLGGLYGLSVIQHSFLLLSQISPVLTVAAGCYIIKDGLMTLILLNILYIVLPQIYIRYISKEGEMTAYFINEFRTKSQQVKTGLSLCGSAFGMVLLSYGFTYLYEDEAVEVIHFPLKSNIFYLIAFFAIFVTINPLLEELYWRIYLMKTYKNTYVYSLAVNLSYTAVHFIVICDLLNWQMAAGFCTYFYSIGRAFDYIRFKYGLITCLMTHYGMTVASSIALVGFLILQMNQKRL